MKVVTQKQMVEIDRKTIEDYLIPSSVLMENAGINLTKHILSDFPDILSKKISILIGIGNNGGDGSVIARQLYNLGYIANIFFIGNRDKLKGDALINLNILIKLGFKIHYIESENVWSEKKHEIFSCEYIIDCLFGTGLSSLLSGIYVQVVNDINYEYKGCVLSVDIPSGLVLSETNINDNIVSIKANTTYTVGLPKLGMLDYPARMFTGILKIVNIGFPKELLFDNKFKYNLIDDNLALSLLPKRISNSHKGNYGHLLIIGGSRKYSGAVVLASKASFRTGCGLVTVASIDDCCNTVRFHIPEIIFLPLTENGDGIISKNNVSILIEYVKKINTIVIGPGIGLHSDIEYILKTIINDYSGNILIDADALNILSHNLDFLKSSSAKIVITPHVKEMSRLCNVDIETIKTNKISITQKFACEFNVTVVLKDATTLIVSPDGQVYFNIIGNNGMSKGGSGDVLSGIIGSLMAQGLSSINSSVLGVYLHALSGDLSSEQLGQHSMLPSDIVNNLPNTILKLKTKE